MAQDPRFENLVVTGSFRVGEDQISAQTRATILKQDATVPFPIPLTSFRVWDAIQTVIPGTASSDDLALIGTSFGSVGPVISAGDLKAAGSTTRYTRNPQVVVPECYDNGETLQIDIYAGMQTTVADVSCTVDVECYRLDKLGAIGSDLCTTSAQSINSLTIAKKSFAINPASLSKGDILDVRITVACNDAASAGAVKPTIGGIDLVCDIKG